MDIPAKVILEVSIDVSRNCQMTGKELELFLVKTVEETLNRMNGTEFEAFAIARVTYFNYK
jgi:hypothetical protein